MYLLKVKGSLPLFIYLKFMIIFLHSSRHCFAQQLEQNEVVITAIDIEGNKGNKSLHIDMFSSSYPVTVYMWETTPLSFNYSLAESDDMSFPSIVASVDKEDKVEILNKTTTISNTNKSGSFLLLLKGKLPGRANLAFALKYNTDDEKYVKQANEETSFKLYIELKERLLDTMFTSVVIMLVVITNIGMGAKIDLDIVKKELRRPIAPFIGMCSQFIFMPLIAFTLAYNLDLEPGVALGFFALGCSPGGSASNAYTYLLKGNVSLSVTMTLISSLASLGMLPLWLFTLGRLIYAEGDITIPYSNIIFSLIGIVTPIGIGLLLKWKFPKVAEFFIKAVKYVVAVFFIFVFSVGIYANYFIFLLINWGVIIASACLPYLGFAFGALLSFIARQSKPNIIAIALETGIQNTGIPIILLRLSLSGPEKDTGIVSPIVSAIFTPIPIMIAIAYVQIKDWLNRRKGKEEDLVLESAHKDNLVFDDSE